jgi:hypothetical protein
MQDIINLTSDTCLKQNTTSTAKPVDKLNIDKSPFVANGLPLTYAELAKKIPTTATDINTFKAVTYKRNKNKPVIGTRNDEATGLKAAPRKTWLFITKTEKNTDVTTMNAHIESILKHKNFSCEEALSKHGNKNFKVSADFSEHHELINPENWPSGININRYIFRKSQPNDRGT